LNKNNYQPIDAYEIMQYYYFTTSEKMANWLDSRKTIGIVSYKVMTDHRHQPQITPCQQPYAHRSVANYLLSELFC